MFPGGRHRLPSRDQEGEVDRPREAGSQGFPRPGTTEKLQGFGPMVSDLMSGAAELAETTDVKG